MLPDSAVVNDMANCARDNEEVVETWIFLPVLNLFGLYKMSSVVVIGRFTLCSDWMVCRHGA